MLKTILSVSAALVFVASTAWAQTPAQVVAPVTTPQTTGSMVQGTSDAAKTVTPPPAAADAKAKAMQTPAPAPKDVPKK